MSEETLARSMLLKENKMRPIPALVLGVLGCGAAASFLMTPGRALAQPNVRSAQSMQSTDRDLETLLAAFADAWNRHDVDLLMSMMTDDGVFEASAGNHVNGERHEGQQAVRAAYAAVFAEYPDAHWGNARHFVKADRGVSEWTFTGTLKDGRRVEVTGCDLFTFRDGKIAVKNSFRKNRLPTM